MRMNPLPYNLFHRRFSPGKFFTLRDYPWRIILRRLFYYHNLSETVEILKNDLFVRRILKNCKHYVDISLVTLLEVLSTCCINFRSSGDLWKSAKINPLEVSWTDKHVERNRIRRKRSFLCGSFQQIPIIVRF